MDAVRWNRLIGRAMRACRGLPRARAEAVKRRWLAWADRVTGRNCFWARA
jgi:phage baseplate assembly protein gpV